MGRFHSALDSAGIPDASLLARDLGPLLLTGTRTEADDPPSSSASERGGRLIICGLPGDDEHRKLFAETVEKLHKALTERYGFAASEVLVRFGVDKQAGDGPALARARGDCRTARGSPPTWTRCGSGMAERTRSG